MKVRKLAVALALAGGLGSGMAQALGLGEIELQSWLNEPLDAEISLRQSAGVDPGDVFVNVAPEAAYERVGLERNHFLSKLKFEVVTGSDGNLAINVSSREPVREPYLNFLLELTWPNGRLMREYAVLVDPPVYAEESGVREQVSAPSASTASRQTSTRSPESERRQAQAQGAPARGYQADSFGPTGPSDTLWTIAQRLRPNNSVSMQQTMLAIQDLNPDAFIDGNINKLKRGQVLRAPTLEQIQNRSKAEANRVVARQNEEFQSPRPVDATRTAEADAPGEAGSATGASSAGSDELKLLVAGEEADPRTGEEGGSAGGDGDQAGGVDAGSAVAMEELEASRRENEELSSRLQDMEEQVKTLQRLLELKNSQLADLQGMTEEEADAALAAANGESADAELAEGENAEAGADAAEGAVADGEGESGQAEDATGANLAGETEEDAMAEDGGEETVAEADSDDAAAGTDEVSEAVESDAEAERDSQESADETSGDETADAAAPVAGADEAGSEPEAGSGADEPAPATGGAAQEQQPPAATTQQPAEPAQNKGFFGQLMDTILGNPMYQIALGGGLILLLLLLLLVARKNANREKEFYDEFNRGEDEGGDDSIDLTPAAAGAAGAVAGAAAIAGSGEEEGSDALAEAETYIAYGRNDQAVQVLETAISREPSRADLRLKLLSVYADNQDRDSFEKQYGEIAALEDDAALQQAEDIRSRLDEAESMPSIDDLESQLRSDSFTMNEPREEGSVESESSALGQEEDWALSDELKADEFESSLDEVKENEFGELESDIAEETESDANTIDFDLSGFDLDTEENAKPVESADAPASSTGEDDLSLELGELDELSAESSDIESETPESELSLEAGLSEEDLASLEGGLADEQEPAADSEEASVDTSALDESFLDELDAELEKVSGEGEGLEDLDLEDSSLDELELDVSDEDLALMEEFSESDSLSVDEQPEVDEELGLEDALQSLEADEDDLPVVGTDPEELVSDAEEDDASLDELSSSIPDIDESDLEDDDFDFLAGTDEAATKLDLARAYIEMGDSDGARDILEEVALEGNDDQKAEAQELLKNLS